MTECRDAKVLHAEMITLTDRKVKINIVHSKTQNKFSLAGVIRSQDRTGPFNHIKKLGVCFKSNGDIEEF